jgi:hypothetical protein
MCAFTNVRRGDGCACCRARPHRLVHPARNVQRPPVAEVVHQRCHINHAVLEPLAWAVPGTGQPKRHRQQGVEPRTGAHGLKGGRHERCATHHVHGETRTTTTSHRGALRLPRVTAGHIERVLGSSRADVPWSRGVGVMVEGGAAAAEAEEGGGEEGDGMHGATDRT